MMHYTGISIILAIVLVLAIPYWIHKAFSSHSRYVTDRSYLESAHIELQVILERKKQRISELESGELKDEFSDASVSDTTIWITLNKESSQNWINLPQTVLTSQLITNTTDGSDVEVTQREMEFDFPAETTAQMFSRPKIESFKQSELPDVSFLKRLNIVMPEVQSENAVQFHPAEVNPQVSPKTELESEQQLVQDEFDFPEGSVEKREYSWSVGSQFLYLRIEEHYGLDIAKCVILETGDTTVIQYPTIFTLSEGDTFAASMLVNSIGKREVLKIWPGIETRSKVIVRETTEG